MKGKIYNIPYSVPFLETIAERFLPQNQKEPFGLSDVLFLMPNRRSCLSLKEAFLQLNGMSPFLLPKIIPVLDIKEEDLFLSPFSPDINAIEQAISPEERLFLLAKMIYAQHQDYGIEEISYTQSFSLALDLSHLLDEAELADLSFDKIENIVPEEYATHWQETLKFLKIVTAYWPEILKERGVTDPALRRLSILQKQAEIWKKAPQKQKIVAVGLSLANKGLEGIIQCVSEIENGEIYIEGLDRFLNDEEWKNLSLLHPQYEKKELLNLLNIKREDVPDLKSSQNNFREKIISEMMRPPETTMKWREVKENSDLQKGLEGIGLIETQNTYEEAMSIALIMREVLQTPSKTAALVTTDRDLARLVQNDLKKYDVEIDDSAGVPLHLTPIAIYLRQILNVLENDFDFPSTLALLKNPYVCIGQDAKEFKKQVEAFELENRKPAYDEQKVKVETEKVQKLLIPLFSKLRDLYKKEKVPFKALLEEHIYLAEKLASDRLSTGDNKMWCQAEGKLAAGVLSKLLQTADIAGDIEPFEYSSLLVMLFSRETVRKPYGSHPRLKILGPIEARFNHFDVIILGSFNEGIWPQTLVSDPFMSRSMKTQFGLPMPERSIGVTANDICRLMCSDEVYLTRSEKSYGTPTNKSRYLLRLETVIQALGLSKKNIENSFYTTLVQKLETSQKVQSCLPPCPKPPKEARPNHFSSSSLKKLIENPYEIYASYILGLKPLKDFNAKPDMRDFGNLVHKTLERFVKVYPLELDTLASKVLFDIFEEELIHYDLSSQSKVFWRAKFARLSEWVLEKEKVHRKDLKKILTEIRGQILFENTYILSARADRLEEDIYGDIKIVDYKTGNTPTSADVHSGFEPQLPLEALILENGGFQKENTPVILSKATDLIYWDLKKNNEISMVNKKKEESPQEQVSSLVEEIKEKLKALLTTFDDEKTPYLYAPNPKHMPTGKDYEHLSRVQEWRGESNGNY